MRKCTYCGKEYPNEASACAIDGNSLTGENPPDNRCEASLSSPPPGVAKTSLAKKNMLFGALWCFGGIIVTVVTINNSGGRTYIVAWGAIFFGGIQFLRGLLASGDKQKEVTLLNGEQNEGVCLFWKCPRCNKERDFNFIMTTVSIPISGSSQIIDLRCSVCKYEIRISPQEKPWLTKTREATRLLKLQSLTPEAYRTTIASLPTRFSKDLLALTEVWKCSKCGEENPVSFDDCWNCHSKGNHTPDSMEEGPEPKPFPGISRGGNPWE